MVSDVPLMTITLHDRSIYTKICPEENVKKVQAIHDRHKKGTKRQFSMT